MPAERKIALICFAISGVLLVLVFIAGNLFGALTSIVIVLVAALSSVGLITFKYGYWIVPLLTRRVRVIDVIEEPYEITPTQDAVIKKVGNTYYASMFLQVKIYESTTEKSEEEKFAFMELWERAVASMKLVTKFVLHSYVKDLSKYRAIVENKKAEAQLKLADEKGKQKEDKQRIETLEREVAMWDNLLSKLSTGENPIAQMTYIMTTASGPTPDMALAAVKNQANEIKSTIATTLNAEVAVLTGEDMRRCFEVEYTAPPMIREEAPAT